MMVKFKNTGYIRTAKINKLIKGKVQDISIMKKENISGILSSNRFGDFEVLEDLGPSNKFHDRLFKIKFIKTGYVGIYTLRNITVGEVKDPYYPIVYSIGYCGEEYSYFKDTDKELYKSLRSRWERMMSRCYNKNDTNYHIYGKLGVRVDKRWHNLSNYLNDVLFIKGYNRDKVISDELELDKDLLQIGIPSNKKVYSKDTCLWVKPSVHNYRNYSKFIK